MHSNIKDDMLKNVIKKKVLLWFHDLDENSIYYWN